MKLFKALIILFIILSPTPVLAKKETISVKPGTVFSIELKSNPTTGYQWQVKELNKYFLELESSTFIPALNENTNIVGSGGVELWSFKAIKPGQTSISFFYSRSWENKKPIQKKTFNVFIKD